MLTNRPVGQRRPCLTVVVVVVVVVATAAIAAAAVQRSQSSKYVEMANSTS
jgi:hypothetical protein